jgi:serine/threonine protein phosphatase 1
LGTFKPFSSRRVAATDPGDRIYAIGDVHGRYDLLRELMHKIGAHAEARGGDRTTYVMLLGDLVDRGPDSWNVLNYVHDLQSHTPNLLVLAGNHEELMIRALDGEPGLLNAWLRIGGDATLRSCGIEPPSGPVDAKTFGDLAAEAVGEHLLDWMRSLPVTAESGDYFFCHAGVRPGVPLKKQSRNDLLWIREEFLSHEKSHGSIIVHGHSITVEAQIRENRIGLDTGAYRSGMLTAICLEGTYREILSVSGNGASAGHAERHTLALGDGC